MIKRIFEHKTKQVEGFTAKYGVDKLVYFAEFDSIQDAITKEKQLKKWKRDWKINLIEQDNPYWEDLYKNII